MNYSTYLDLRSFYLCAYESSTAPATNHVVNASALAASTATDVGFIGFNLISGVATNPILVGMTHAGPQFVKNLESRLVAR